MRDFKAEITIDGGDDFHTPISMMDRVGELTMKATTELVEELKYNGFSPRDFALKFEPFVRSTTQDRMTAVLRAQPL